MQYPTYLMSVYCFLSKALAAIDVVSYFPFHIDFSLWGHQDMQQYAGTGVRRRWEAGLELDI